VDVLLAICEAVTPEEIKALVLVQMRNLWGDKSWRARHAIAEKFVAVS
jgi:hypothetical protein